MRALVFLVLAACVNAQHAEVRLPGNAAGADCFTRCVQTTTGAAGVACVAQCPGGHRDDGDCDDGSACVEHRKMSTGKTALVAIGGAVLLLYVTSR